MCCNLIVASKHASSNLSLLETFWSHCKKFRDVSVEMSEVSQGTATRTFTTMQTLSQSITAAGLTTTASSIATVSDGNDDDEIMMIGNSTKTSNSTSEMDPISSSSSGETQAGFPFVTMPYFHVQGYQTLTIGGADIVLYAPLVPMDQKEEWESYASNNQQWLAEGLEYQHQRLAIDSQHQQQLQPGNGNETVSSIPHKIYSFGENDGATLDHDHERGDIHVPGYYLPVWQIYGRSIDAGIVNLDLLTAPSLTNTTQDGVFINRHEFEDAVADALQHRKGIISNIADYSYLTDSATASSNGMEDDDDHAYASPQSFVMEPVYASFDNAINGDAGQENIEIVGFVISIVTWKDYLHRFLLETAADNNEEDGLGSKITASAGNDVHVVMNDGCGNVHTYEIFHSKDGATNVDYLGNFDLHQPQYNDFRSTINFAPFARVAESHPRDYVFDGPSES